jgi:multidrug transporter EmrE-like cation transporter
MSPGEPPIGTSSRSNHQSIFDNALEAYKEKTKIELRSHPLLPSLENCDSPAASLALLLEQVSGPNKSRKADGGLAECLEPTVKALYTFSGNIRGRSILVSLCAVKASFVLNLVFNDMQVYSPAAVIFTGISVILSVGISLFLFREPL